MERKVNSVRSKIYLAIQNCFCIVIVTRAALVTRISVMSISANKAGGCESKRHAHVSAMQYPGKGALEKIGVKHA